MDEVQVLHETGEADRALAVAESGERPARSNPALVLDFARKVIKPGGKALLVTPHNDGGGWVPVEEAVHSGRSFAVDVADDILAADCDRPELAASIRALAEHLRCECVTPILVASGRPGHLHLFARVRGRALLQRYKALARARGFDVRRTIRPPLAPHRLGLAVYLVEPDEPAEALAALLPPPAPRELSPRVAELLLRGDTEARYAERGKRSSVVMAIVTGMVNSRWTYEDGFRELRNPRNVGGAKIQQRGERAAWRYFMACWAKAEKLVAARPPVRHRGAALARIAQVRAAVESFTWRGASGATDRRVMEAHLIIAGRAGKIVYGAAVRSVAELAGCGLEAVVNAHHRLQEQGWLVLVRRAARWNEDSLRPNTWALRSPERTSHGTSDDERGGSREPNSSSPFGGDEEDCSVLVSPDPGLGGDVWRWGGGLGGYAWLVWRSLRAGRPQGSGEIALLLRKDQVLVRRILARLGKHHLAVHDEKWRWTLGPSRPEEVSLALSTSGDAERQRRRHDDQRRLFKASRDWKRRQGFRP